MRATRGQHRRLARMWLNHVGLEHAPEGLRELALLKELLLRSKDFRVLMEGPQFSRAEKAKALEELRQRLSLSEDTVKFMRYLIEGNQVGLLPDILGAALQMYMERTRRAEAVVYSPVELEAPHMERLKGALERLLQRQVQLQVELQPELLGGAVVKVGSSMFDSSLRGQLRLLKEELIKG